LSLRQWQVLVAAAAGAAGAAQAGEAKANKSDSHALAFQWSNPDRSLGRKAEIAVSPVVATQNNTVNVAQHNGQPAYGDDDFFTHY
jgi:hypothetical protein